MYSNAYTNDAYKAMHVTIGSVVSIRIGREKCLVIMVLGESFIFSCGWKNRSFPVSLRRRWAFLFNSTGAYVSGRQKKVSVTIVNVHIDSRYSVQRQPRWRLTVKEDPIIGP